MSDTELRMKIARLRGWRFDPSGMWLGPADIDGSRLASYFCPDWPNSIADAWELFAELPAKKALICRGNNQWTCGCNGEKKMTNEIVRNLFMVRVKAGDSFESMSILAKRAEVVDGDLMIFDYPPAHVSVEDWLVQAFKAGYWLSVSVLAQPEK